MLPTFYGHRGHADESTPTVGGGALDEASLAAGPGMALVADSTGLRGACRFDHEHGAALEDIDPAGWVS